MSKNIDDNIILFDFKEDGNENRILHLAMVPTDTRTHTDSIVTQLPSVVLKQLEKYIVDGRCQYAYLLVISDDHMVDEIVKFMKDKQEAPIIRLTPFGGIDEYIDVKIDPYDSFPSYIDDSHCVQIKCDDEFPNLKRCSGVLKIAFNKNTATYKSAEILHAYNKYCKEHERQKWVKETAKTIIDRMHYLIDNPSIHPMDENALDEILIISNKWKVEDNND